MVADQRWLEKINPHVHNFWAGTWTKGTIEPTRILRDHELVVVTSGECTIVLNDRPYVLKARDFLIVPPRVPHLTRVRGKQVFRHCIHFDWAEQEEIDCNPFVFGPKIEPDFACSEAPLFVPGGLLYGTFPDSSPVEGLLGTLGFHWDIGDKLNIGVCRGILLQILYFLFSNGSGEKNQTASKKLAYQVKRRLDWAPHEMISIKELLDDMNYSYEHLVRVFRGEFGVSPMQYLNQTRLERAKLLLRESKLNVSEVASKVGFTDAAYFIRFFRKHMTMTPGQYAKTAEAGW